MSTRLDAALPEVAVPVMPVRPQDVPVFERQVAGYVNDLAVERAKQMEQVEACTLALACTGKLLNLKTPHRPVPWLGLHQDGIEPKAVFPDDPACAAAVMADSLTRFLSTSAVAHFDENSHHQALEKAWRTAEQIGRQLLSQLLAQTLVGPLDSYKKIDTSGDHRTKRASAEKNQRELLQSMGSCDAVKLTPPCTSP